MTSSLSLRPVLLVPGWSDTARVVEPARVFLIRNGWPQQQVRCLDFRDRYGSNRAHAAEIAAAIDDLLQRSGSGRVDVVAHSMGGLALRWFLGGDQRDVVRTAIFLATPHYGTRVAWLAWGEGGREMRPDSTFLRELALRPMPPTVRAFCLRTPIDTRILPGSSALLEGTDCHVVRMPTHQRMPRHTATLALIRDLLQRP